MKFKKLFPVISIVLMIASSGLSSCKKDKSEPDEKLQLTIENAEVLPGKNVVLTLDEPSARESFEINIDGKSMVFYKIDETRYSGIMPVIAEGNYSINIPGVSLTTPVTIRVLPYAPITDATPVLSEFINEISSSLDTLRDLNNMLPGSIDMELIERLSVQYEESVAKLSAAEKVDLAYYLKANPFRLSALTQTVADPSGSRIRVMDDAGDRLVITSQKMAVAVSVAAVSAAAIVGSAYLAYNFPNSWSVAALCGSLLSYKISCSYAGFQASEVGKLKGIPEALLDWYQTNAVLVLSKDVVPGIALPMQYRTVEQQDINHANPLIKSIVANDKKLVSEDGNVGSAMQKVLKYLPGVSKYAPYMGSVASVANKEEKNAPATNLSINNISDPTIDLTYTKEGDKLKIKATSTSGTERAFTFDVVYTNTALGITVKKTINAAYSGPFANKIEVFGGNNQVGVLGKKLDNPLKVLVKDAAGAVLPGAKVEWKVKSGGGILSGAESVTDANGIAQIEWTLGPTGVQVVEAFAKKKDGTLAGGSPLLFSAAKEPFFLKGYYEVTYPWGEKLLLNTSNSVSNGLVLYYDDGNKKWFAPGYTFSASHIEPSDGNQNGSEYIAVSIQTQGCLTEYFKLTNLDPAKKSFSGTYTDARCYYDKYEGSAVTVKYLGLTY